MSTTTHKLPKIRQDLIVQQLTDEEFVVKLPARKRYFRVGREEHFLLTQMQISESLDAVCRAFEGEFGDTLSDKDIDEFLRLIRSRGLTEEEPEKRRSKDGAKASPRKTAVDDNEDEEDADDFATSGKRVNILFYKKSLYDPNELFNWIEPKIRWVWTRGFVVTTACLMVIAAIVMWTNKGELITTFNGSMRWEMALMATLTIFAATVMHEMGHGLTCKHFGGNVHEVGVMLMFFIPCMYCNVSDAYLIPQRSRRLWITAAGAYCDLCLWAIAVLIWRITVQETFINYLAFLVLTVCGSRGLININPLMRFDGYYLLNDWLGMPNLRKRSQQYWMQHIRHFLWGAEFPEKEKRGHILLIYGVFNWCFALFLLDMVFFRFFKFATDEFGVVGLMFMCLAMMYALRRVFRGFFSSEFVKMITTRHKRTVTWVTVIAVSILGAVVFPVTSYSTGNFEVRPGVLFEVRTPVTGFVQSIEVEQGARVTAGDVLVRLHSPDLANSIATKVAELHESDARLKKLQMGPRPEQVAEQRKKVERLVAWCAMGEQDLQQARKELEFQLAALDNRMQQTQTELTFQKTAFAQSEKLYKKGALAGAQLKEERKTLDVLEAQLEGVRSERQARVAAGVRTADAELARRQQELADARSALSLLEAGTHPEDIAAEIALRERLTKELEYFRHQQEQLIVRATVGGVVATPRMRDKLGQMITVGMPICVIEDATKFRVEIAVEESDVAGIASGQPIILKARALPFETFQATVERIAPSATRPTPDASQSKNVLIVYCKVDNAKGLLKSGMTGFARINRGRKGLATTVLAKAMRYIRTEFWW